jgi:uncharacterized membrane protein YhaH (DUF805 family)
MKKIKKMFEGRLNRRRFLVGWLLVFLINTLVASIVGKSLLAGVIRMSIIQYFLNTILFVRRLHDLNYRGLYPALGVLVAYIIANIYLHILGWVFSTIALLIFIFDIYLAITVGTKGKNNYGDEDKGKSLISIFGL